MVRRGLWCATGALVALMVVGGVAPPAQSAGPDVPAGPAGGSQREVWRLGAPSCSFEQSWVKRPDMLNVHSIALKAAVS